MTSKEKAKIYKQVDALVNSITPLNSVETLEVIALVEARLVGVRNWAKTQTVSSFIHSIKELEK